MNDSLELKNGSKIAIIGGGPAGSFFAIHALLLAKKLKKNIEVIIFEQKGFTARGIKGCNMCAGVCQSRLIESLEQIGITFTNDIIQSIICGYTFWLKGMSANIHEGKACNILSVFRGGDLTETLGEGGKKKGFDIFLLEKAIEMGALCIKEKVTELIFPQKSYLPVRIFFGQENSLEIDLVVGAFGTNSSLDILGLPKTYRKPKVWKAFQVEIPLGESYIKEKLSSMINVYFMRPKGIKYLAATPKGKYLTVSAIGKSVTSKDIKSAIVHSKLSDILPKNWEISCSCHPSIPASAPRGIVEDRFIVVGDASYSRWLKNGIESALYTARFGAETALKYGISKKVLKKRYQNRCIIKFGIDNIFGKMLFIIHDRIMTNRLLSYTYLSLVKKEQTNTNIKKRRLSEVLWYIYTGNISYFSIFLKMINPILQLQLFIQTLILLIKNEGIKDR